MQSVKWSLYLMCAIVIIFIHKMQRITQFEKQKIQAQNLK